MGPNSMTDVLIRRGNLDTKFGHQTPERNMTRERPVRLQEGDHPQSKERSLRRNETCRHLDLELPVSACDEINFCCLNLPICGILLRQLEQTNYCDKAVDFSSCSLQFHGK